MAFPRIPLIDLFLPYNWSISVNFHSKNSFHIYILFSGCTAYSTSPIFRIIFSYFFAIISQRTNKKVSFGWRLPGKFLELFYFLYSLILYHCLYKMPKKLYVINILVCLSRFKALLYQVHTILIFFSKVYKIDWINSYTCNIYVRIKN